MSLPFAPSSINQNRNAIQENNLTCQTCGFVFKNRIYLKGHNKKNQGKCKPLPEKKFSCELCPSSFAQRSGLSRHVSVKHGSPKIHLENEIARFKASDPDFNESQFLQDVFMAYYSIQKMIENKENEPISETFLTQPMAEDVSDSVRSPLGFGIDRFLEPLESNSMCKINC
ncbi:Protein CBG06831 [Caenorhabditis briggsae]|uniref:Protein CBG06831 n=1 Tax=Caenorhabditis briggsae TaxID=6238 RepID=A8X362_CAEBR|nr:Protein CBG06831 [Caenorhabditis briggsae]CAP27072.1 Protein CBG06831 [Caenorhabditis briggsae]